MKELSKLVKFMHYCTHSDKNYLAKGIALYKSLYAQNNNLTLWYLCTDEETFFVLSLLNLPGIKPIQIKELEEFDSKLSASRNNPKSQFGDEYSQFCWTLTPYFVWWLLKNKIKENQELLYCDADLYFYHNPNIISEQCAVHSVGIHQHRFTTYDVNTNIVGEFNVGCVWFKNDVRGIKIAETWKNWLLNPGNEYYEKYGTCGDQKYLDLFIPLFEAHNVKIFDLDNSPIAHGAPWNFNLYNFKENDSVLYKNNTQILLFNHFSHFTGNFEADTWQSSIHGEWKPELGNDDVKKYYERYWQDLKVSNELIQTV